MHITSNLLVVYRLYIHINFGFTYVWPIDDHYHISIIYSCLRLYGIGRQSLYDGETKFSLTLKALCHDVRLDCFIIASLVTKSNYRG